MLLSEIKYQTEIKEFKDISSESILVMLQDVRTDLEKLGVTFAEANLTKVLTIIETGKYEINGNISTVVDLSSAKEIVDIYKKYSEGGCQSCVNLGKEVIDAEDASFGWYCKVSDPDYDAEALIGPRVRYSGFSWKIRKHYSNPCGSWKPRFFPKLEELIK